MWALCRRLKDVIRHAGIGARDLVENDIEGDLCSIWIATFTRFNQPLGFVQSCRIDEDDVLLFGCGVEELAYHIDFAAQLRNQIVHSCGDIMGTGWPEALGEALAI
jgi:hypothetical protein